MCISPPSPTRFRCLPWCVCVCVCLCVLCFFFSFQPAVGITPSRQHTSALHTVVSAAKLCPRDTSSVSPTSMWMLSLFVGLEVRPGAVAELKDQLRHDVLHAHVQRRLLFSLASCGFFLCVFLWLFLFLPAPGCWPRPSRFAHVILASRPGPAGCAYSSSRKAARTHTKKG